MKALSQVVATLSHVPGVVAAMVVGATDGLIVETSPIMGGAADGTDPRKHTAALAAYLYSKVTRASDAARLGTPALCGSRPSGVTSSSWAPARSCSSRSSRLTPTWDE